MLSTRNAFAVAFLGILLALAVATWTYSQLPPGAQIPSHFDADGRVNGYAGAWVLFLMPAIMLTFSGLLLVIPRVEPRRAHLMASASAVSAILLGVIGLMLLVQALIVTSALRNATSIRFGAVLPLAFGALFVLLGVYMPRLRSNFFIGIRTPWTLSSERSWQETHRVGGRIFVAFGVIVMVLSIKPAFAFQALVAGAAAAAVGLTVYSYLVWRSDPDKHRLGT